jgi:hypothetical protein
VEETGEREIGRRGDDAEDSMGTKGMGTASEIGRWQALVPCGGNVWGYIEFPGPDAEV